MTIFLAVAALAVQVVPGTGVRVISKSESNLNILEISTKPKTVSIVEPKVGLEKETPGKGLDFDAHVKSGGKWIKS